MQEKARSRRRYFLYKIANLTTQDCILKSVRNIYYAYKNKYNFNAFWYGLASLKIMLT